MALTIKQVNDVCFLNGGPQMCRYLDEETDANGKKVYLCKKLCPDRKIIDAEITDFMIDMTRKALDPNKQSVPLGDNCSGFVILKTKPQGYDVKA